MANLYTLAFTLLEPFAALVAGCVAAPVLLAIYLLKLRRRPVRVSAIRFWNEAAEDLEANVPLRWLRASWLLLLHALILALLVLAIGRPAWGESGPPRELVILIDRSASMSARDVARGAELVESRLDQAKRQAKAMVEEAVRASDARVAVVAFAYDAMVVDGFTASRARLLEAIDSITSTDQPGNPSAGFRAASALYAAARASEQEAVDGATNPQGGAGESEGARSNQSGVSRAGGAVHLFSDGAFSGAFDAQEGGSTDAQALSVSFTPIGPLASPRGGSVTNPSLAGNLGIVAMTGRRSEADPTVQRVFVRVLASGETSDQPRSAPILFALDGVPAGQRAITIPPGELGASATYEIAAPRGGVVTASLASPDALGADDAASLVLTPPAMVRVLLVTPPAGIDEGPSPSSVASDFLRTVLEELRTGAVRRVAPADYERWAASGELVNFGVVVFDRYQPRQPPPLPSLSFGAGLPTSGLEPTRAEASPGAELPGSFFLSWDRQHPILRDVPLDAVFAVPRGDVRWPDPAANESHQNGPGGSALEEPGERGHLPVVELARGGSGPLVLIQQRGSLAHVVTTFELASSNWTLQVGFPIFVASAIDYLISLASPPNAAAFSTGAPLTVPRSWLKPGASLQRLDASDESEESGASTPEAAERPSESRAISLDPGSFADAVLDSPSVVLAPPERAGIYVLRAAGTDDRLPEGAGSSPPGVNPSPSAERSSDLRVVAVNLCDATETSLAVNPSVVVGGARVEPRRDERPREVWHWFVLVAAGLLVLEWFVYAARSRA
ncbi:MAG: VWA domain-containing protein [Planctomycetota bacterium]|nr:VWA domain-containing protein [Planctomycetota bacterium]